MLIFCVTDNRTRGQANSTRHTYKDFETSVKAHPKRIKSFIGLDVVN